MADFTLYAAVDNLAALLDSYDMTAPGSTERVQCEAEIRLYMQVLPEKVDNVSRILKHWDAQSKLAKQEVERLQERKAAFDRKADALEGYVIGVLSGLAEPVRGTRRLEGKTSTLALGKCPDSVNVTSESQIPESFRVVVPATWRPDKDAIKKALQGGEAVSGAELITDKQRLRIL